MFSSFTHDTGDGKVCVCGGGGRVTDMARASMPLSWPSGMKKKAKKWYRKSIEKKKVELFGVLLFIFVLIFTLES